MLNPNFAKMQANYLFSTVRQKTNEYTAAHPEAKIIRLGIGDVTRPLVPEVIKAMHAAVAAGLYGSVAEAQAKMCAPSYATYCPRPGHGHDERYETYKSIGGLA